MLFIHAILREEIIISRKFYYYLFLNNYYPVVHSYSYLHPQGGTVYLLQIPLTPLTQRCRPFIIYVEWVSTNGDRLRIRDYAVQKLVGIFYSLNLQIRD